MAFDFATKLRNIFSVQAGGLPPDAQEKLDFFKAVAKSDFAALTATIQKSPEALSWNDKAGNGPLYAALKNNSLKSFRLLIDLGANVHQTEAWHGWSNQGQNILGLAVKGGKPDFVRVLLERGANPHARPSGTPAAIDLSAGRKHREEIAGMMANHATIRAEYLASKTADAASATITPTAPPPASVVLLETGVSFTVRSPIKLKNASTAP